MLRIRIDKFTMLTEECNIEVNRSSPYELTFIYYGTHTRTFTAKTIQALATELSSFIIDSEIEKNRVAEKLKEMLP